MKQQAAQNTFSMLMNAQRKAQVHTIKHMNSSSLPTASYTCYKCMQNCACDVCAFCEKRVCQNCIQQCNQCQNLYCSTCSEIDYSLSMDRVFCLSCKQHDSI
ncbi:hypothetical protein BDF20DRAFT_538215 [Mycotypha africana]|uniref:uncharacterized protein n=1 Tax=Mycotypha africana TaxID=64632 RepID=UPI002300B021|nr:uncharacterized protein BDF20DRAFT_538215 [Mycotypha africana]KAI8977006.1 hypothetical protein BDF20DRAFT_538215 [Mycotypha africana]